MFWLLLVLSAQAGVSGMQADVSGTWKAREPAVFESVFESCRLRNVVAHVTQTGDDVSGTYEALVSCSDRNWLDDEWRKRIGTFTGTVDGDTIVLTVDDSLLALEAHLQGDVISGTVEVGDAATWTWSAGRIRH